MTHLNYLKDRRAKRLFNSLNERYFKFVSELPPPVDTLAQRLGTFEGSLDEKPFRGLQNLNPSLTCTPWLFWEIFNELNDETFLHIAEAGMFFVLAVVILDHIVDGQGGPANTMCLFHQELYRRGITGYHKQFDSKSPFWDHFERLANLNINGMAAEIAAQSDPQLHSMDRLIESSYGKVAPIITTIAALAEATHKGSVLEPIDSSLKYITVASQMLDDLGDWEQDLDENHMTLFLTKLAPLEAWDTPQKPSAEDIQSRIDEGWLDVSQLHMVIEWLDRALSAVSHLDCPSWVEYINRYRTLADNHSKSFTARHLRRVLKPFAQNQIKSR